MSDTSDDRSASYQTFVNFVARRNIPFFEDVKAMDKIHNTNWAASITVLGVTYRSDRYTRQKKEALDLAAGKAYRALCK